MANTLDITGNYDYVPGYNFTPDQVPDGMGTPKNRAALDQEMSQYLDRCIQQLRGSPGAHCIMAFDVDGTLNYRYAGSSFTAAMSFFGGIETARKMIELKSLGAEFVALTGASADNVKANFTKWKSEMDGKITADPSKDPQKNILQTGMAEMGKALGEDKSRFEAVLDSFTVIKCDSTDTKGIDLGKYIENKSMGAQEIIVNFLDDSCKNAGEMVPVGLISVLAQSENVNDLKNVTIHSTWFPTGIGDLNEKQQKSSMSGGDYSYPNVYQEASELQDPNRTQREACLEKKAIDTTTIQPKFGSMKR